MIIYDKGVIMKRLVIAFLLIPFLVGVLNSETLTGRILDSGNLKGIPDVIITIQSIQKQIRSDQNGMFNFYDLETGNYSVYFHHSGYQSVTKEITIPFDGLWVISINRKSHKLEGISISDTRAKVRDTPVPYKNITNDEIQENLQGQDLPLILDEVPGLFSYSDSGSGSGYSYLKLRGFDQKRIGVMINGIPLNDPEDHRVYWVDMPDFAESIEDIQFQRGVGASRYGIASMGGSVNIETASAADDYSSKFDQLYFLTGSYNTRKMGFKYYSFLNDNLKLNIRLSRISSDGYRDNSDSELTSIYGSLNYLTERSVTDFNFYTGHEITHAAWNASWEEDLKKDHQHNPITYDNEIDDFEQPHFEIHNLYEINDRLQLKNTLFYIKGKGYYEQLKEGADLWEYGLADEEGTAETDIIRQKWVDKDQIGWINNLLIQHKQGELSLGTYLSYFQSEHWGEIDDFYSCPIPENFIHGQKYHHYEAVKKYLTAYLNENYQPLDKLNIMANLHWQYITYDFEQKEAGNSLPT